LRNEVTENDGTLVQRYWISILPIKTVIADDLPECLYVIRQSFATVAEEFGLTEQNAATNGAFMKIERLQNEFEHGNLMFAYIADGKIVGFAELAKVADETYELKKLSVLPECRHNGYGKELIEFAKAKVRGLGGNKIAIGIIEENTVLKNWYAANGFTHTGTQKFDHLSFTVGFMECVV
jgi:ribosomal protein S18 acetylase RimI-like enzyme